MNLNHTMGTTQAHEAASSMIGESEAMRRARKLMQRFARCNAPVLIEGETGTGKELAAREIHYASVRYLGPFVPINCGALPESLLESELFGHRRGAFTDAKSDQPGLIEYASGGTLFLDEVDSLPLRAQTTLLRFLQSGEFRAVGSQSLRTADVRVLAATNVSLTAAVDSGQFRRDLLYRLNPLQVSLPPLRERGIDIALLARHLLAGATAQLEQAPRRWSPDAIAVLSSYAWPGNVRELENVVLRVCMRSDSELIGPDELALAEPALVRSRPRPSLAMGPAVDVDGEAPVSFDSDREQRASAPSVEIAPAPDAETATGSAFMLAKQRAIAAFERRYLTDLMRQAGGNVSQAARLSGTERRQLGKLLKRYGIRLDPQPAVTHRE